MSSRYCVPASIIFTQKLLGKMHLMHRSGLTKSFMKIYCGQPLKGSHIRVNPGILLLRASDWNPSDANIIIYCDACMDGMGFWYPDSGLAFYSHVPRDVPVDFIFYYEALCVLSAFQHASPLSITSIRIAIYTNNSNTVDIFHSLRCLPAYNQILKEACSTQIATEHQLRVFYVSGDHNGVANAISRQQFPEALAMRPDLNIYYFQPPQLPLGATKK